MACGEGGITIGKNQFLEEYNNIGHLNKSFEQNAANIPGVYELNYIKTTTDNKLISLDNHYQNILKFKADGTLDSSFGTNGISNIFISNNFLFTDMLLQPDNKILVNGYDYINNRIVIARYNYKNDTTVNHLTKTTSVQNFQLEKNSIRVYPNPAGSYIQIDGLKEGIISNLIVADINEKTVLNTTTSSSVYKLNIQKF